MDTIKFYKPHEGFGFIRRETGPDLFFHISGVSKTYQPVAGDPVSFDVERDARGRELATNIKPLNRSRLEAERIFRAADAA